MNNFIEIPPPPPPRHLHQHVSFRGLEAPEGLRRELSPPPPPPLMTEDNLVPSLVSKGRWKVERTSLTANEKATLRFPSHVIAEPPDGWRINLIVQRKHWGDHTAVWHDLPPPGCEINPARGRLLSVYLEADDGESEVQHQVWKDDQGWTEIPPGERERAPLPTRPDEPSLRFDTQHEDGEGL